MLFAVNDWVSVFQPTLPARGATKLYPCKFAHWLFQPTLPARGATYALQGNGIDRAISTHAPRTGSDGFFRQEGGCDL